MRLPATSTTTSAVRTAPAVSTTESVSGYARVPAVGATSSQSAVAVSRIAPPTFCTDVTSSGGAPVTETASAAAASCASLTVATTPVTVGPPWRTPRRAIPAMSGAVFAEVIAKSASDTSKKMLPTAATRTRACVVAMPAGSVTCSLPSFGVLLASSIGHVAPPSIDSVMRTFAVDTGASALEATFHATVATLPAANVAAVFGAVTANGPAAFATVTTVLASFVPPPPARLSRTVTRKFSVRLTFGSTSPVMNSGLLVPGRGAVAGTAFAFARM